MSPPPQISAHASSSSSASSASSVKLEDESNPTGDNSSNEIQQILPKLSIHSSNTRLSQSSITVAADAHADDPVQGDAQDTQSVLDQHEDDITQFLHNYSQESAIIDQFDVTQALMQQSQAVRVPSPRPPPPPLRTYDALLSGEPPGRRSPSLPIEETTNRMLFGKNDKALSHRRRMFASTSAFTNYEADLTSSDRLKAKQAVMRFLKDKIRNDWEYTWPRPMSATTDTENEFDDDTAADWREREDWESGISEDDEEYQREEPQIPDKQEANESEQKSPALASPPQTPIPGTGPEEPVAEKNAGEPGGFRFESPEEVGEIVQKKLSEKKERRRTRRLELQSWNEGLDCWTQRRDAWTCAKKIVPPEESLSPSQKTQDPAPSEKGKGREEDPTPKPPITQIPIAYPLIPTENSIRAQVGPAVYGKIYEKVVTLSITPTVPINLKDMTRSCVEGWKTDGQWPPKPTAPEPAIAQKKGLGRLKALGLLGRGRRESGGSFVEKSEEGGSGGRKGSLASVLGLEKVRSAFRRGSGSVGSPLSPPPTGGCFNA